MCHNDVMFLSENIFFWGLFKANINMCLRLNQHISATPCGLHAAFCHRMDIPLDPPLITALVIISGAETRQQIRGYTSVSCLSHIFLPASFREMGDERTSWL